MHFSPCKCALYCSVTFLPLFLKHGLILFGFYLLFKWDSKLQSTHNIEVTPSKDIPNGIYDDFEILN